MPVTKIYPPHELGYSKMRPFVDWWSILRPVVYLGLGLKNSGMRRSGVYRAKRRKPIRIPVNSWRQSEQW